MWEEKFSNSDIGAEAKIGNKVSDYRGKWRGGFGDVPRGLKAQGLQPLWGDCTSLSRQ